MFPQGPVLCLSLLIGACSHASAEAPRCQLGVASRSFASRPGDVVLLGEMHGTQETPQFLGELACLVGQTGQSLIVGLEIPRSEQTRINTYLDSDGTSANRQALLAGPFWQRPYQDGRSSNAMSVLIERARVLRKQGVKLELLAFDVTPERMTAIDGVTRDKEMADAIIKRVAATSHAVTLVLTGNIHIWTQEGTPWDPRFVPMGVHLRAAYPSLTSLDVSLPPGAAWMCTGKEAATCGVKPLSKGSRKGVAGQPSGIELFNEPDEHGVRGVYRVPSATPSRPAKIPRTRTSSRQTRRPKKTQGGPRHGLNGGFE